MSLTDLPVRDSFYEAHPGAKCRSWRDWNWIGWCLALIHPSVFFPASQSVLKLNGSPEGLGLCRDIFGSGLPDRLFHLNRLYCLIGKHDTKFRPEIYLWVKGSFKLNV